MSTLKGSNFKAIPTATVWLLNDCMEFRGKQELWKHQTPEILRALRDQAIIQSVESSNRIEGVTIDPGRLRPIVLENARPRDRSEEELAGYRKALDWISTRKSKLAIDERVILHLHALAQGGMSGDAGTFKTKDNEIIEIKPGGVGRVVRFRPTPAKQTPAAIEELCETYGSLIESGDVPPLLVIATFVFDFLCIHPFRDGNGRVSRLLTTLLLNQNDFIVGQYISLERLVEDSRDEYYRVLNLCSQKWAEGRNEIAPWWNYFLTILRRGYCDFATKIEQQTKHGAKTDMARHQAMQMTGPFTLAELRGRVHGASPQLIKKLLNTLKGEGLMKLTGRGRSARWERTQK